MENLEDDPVFMAEYKTNRTKMPILTIFSEPKWILETSGLDLLKRSAKLLLHLASEIKNYNNYQLIINLYKYQMFCLKLKTKSPGPLLSADHVRYTTYKLTIDDCNNPDFSWTRCTHEVIEIELINKQITTVSVIKNLFNPHPSSCKKKSSTF